MGSSSAYADLKPRKSKALLDPVLKKAWRQFRVAFKKPTDCLAAIVRKLIERGVVYCRTCGLQEWGEVDGRMATCLHCGDQTSVTAGTFFDHMRAFRAWMAAIWFAERGIVVSSATFRQLLNIAQSSARFILKRVWTALHGKMEQDSLKVPRGSFFELICRHCIDAYPQQAPPAARAECGDRADGAAESQPAAERELERCSEDGQASNSKDEENVSDRDNSAAEAAQNQETPPVVIEIQALLLRALRDKPLSADELSKSVGFPIWQTNATLTGLELTGLCERLPGNRFALSGTTEGGSSKNSGPALSVEAQSAVKLSIEYLRSVFNGIGGKYLHLYLVAYWCHSTGCQPRQQSVFEICISYGKTTCRQIFKTRELAMVAVCKSMSVD